MKQPFYEDTETNVNYIQIIPANPGWKAVYSGKDENGNREVYLEPVIAWGVRKVLYLEKDEGNLGGDIASLYYRTEMVGFTRIPGAGYSIYSVDDGMVEAHGIHHIGYDPPSNEKTYDEEDWETLIK